MTPQDYADLQRAMRTSLLLFADRCFRHLNPGVDLTPGWHIELVAQWLESLQTDGSRMIINLPPRHLKSLLASVALPAWLLGHNPGLKFICVSYGAELSEALSRDCRAVMQSAWYKALFPGTKLQRIAVNELSTTAGGSRLATSIDGVLTGRGADYIIIDDPIKPDDALSNARARVNEFYNKTLYPRLNDKRRGRILLVMQRLHENDLTGHLLAQGGWTHLRLPAIAEEDLDLDIETTLGSLKICWKAGEALHPEREPLETLEVTRATLGEYNFAGQYLQRPAPAGGGRVKRGWFKFYTHSELPQHFDTVLQSWDTASKPTELADYSVCTTWGIAGARCYLLHVFRKKCDFPHLKRAVREQAALHQATVVLIEDKASGTQLIQDLQYEGMHEVKGYTPQAGANKEMRLEAQTPKMENGFVFLPHAAEWLEDYLHEMTTFPAASYDDQVDSTAQALHWISLNDKPVPHLLTYYENLNRGISMSGSPEAEQVLLRAKWMREHYGSL